MPRALDLTNQRFGKLIALYPLKERKNGKIQWHCQCDCGNTIDVISSSLKSGKTSSCGCLQKERTKQTNTLDLIGQKFNRLTVIERTNDGKWKCLCDCGNFTYASTTKLKTGHTQSCGCLQKERTSEASLIDLTGKRFGKLTVLYRDPNTKKRVRWICQCDCGNIVNCAGSHLNNGDVKSCGCLTMSHGELKIKELLDNAQIPYQQEYIFKDCINTKTNKPLRFDFFVDNKYIIEYDGKQHTVQDRNNAGWGESIENIQMRDTIKNNYCKTHNIPLIRIPYTHYNNLCLNDLVLTTTNFLLK